jgi:hypothetical protein
MFGFKRVEWGERGVLQGGLNVRGDIRGTRDTLVYTLPVATQLAGSGANMWLHHEQVQCDRLLGPVMPSSGSVQSLSVIYDVVSAEGGPLWLEIRRDGGYLTRLQLFTLIADVNTEIYHFNRYDYPFAAEQILGARLFLSGDGEINIRNVIVSLDVNYD